MKCIECISRNRDAFNQDLKMTSLWLWCRWQENIGFCFCNQKYHLPFGIQGLIPISSSTQQYMSLRCTRRPMKPSLNSGCRRSRAEPGIGLQQKHRGEKRCAQVRHRTWHCTSYVTILLSAGYLLYFHNCHGNAMKRSECVSASKRDEQTGRICVWIIQCVTACGSLWNVYCTFEKFIDIRMQD